MSISLLINPKFTTGCVVDDMTALLLALYDELITSFVFFFNFFLKFTNKIGHLLLVSALFAFELSQQTIDLAGFFFF